MNQNRSDANRARLAVIFLATTNVFILLYAPQPLLPLFSEEFGVSVATASLTISVTIISLAVSSFFLASWSDRWKRKHIILFSSGILVFPSIALVFSQPFEWVLFWRMLHGLFIPGVSAMLVAYASEEFGEGQRGRIMGVYVSATVMGGLLGRVMSGPIAQAASWHAVFVTVAGISFLIFLLVWRLLPPSRNQTERDERSFWVHFSNPALLGTFFIGFSQFFAFIGFFTYLPFYASEAPFHLNVAQISMLYGTYLFGIFSAPASGWLSDRIGRRAAMAIGHVIGGSGICLTLWPSLPMLITGASLLALGNFASQSAATAYVTDVATKSRGAASSLYLVFFYAGGSLGAYLPGLLWGTYQWYGLVALTCGTIFLALVCNAILAGRTTFSWHRPTRGWRNGTAGEAEMIETDRHSSRKRSRVR